MASILESVFFSSSFLWFRREPDDYHVNILANLSFILLAVGESEEKKLGEPSAFPEPLWI